METSHRPLVLFHDQCVDGLAAAWIVWRRYFDRADYVAVRYGEPPPDCSDRLVFIVDFSYSPEVTMKIADQASRVVVIDHHMTAIEKFAAWKSRHDVDLIFDIEHSGAQLTARYFNANARLWVIDYVEDRDLWKFALPDSHAVNALIAALSLGKPPIDAFRALEDLRGLPMKMVVEQGKGAQLQLEAYARQVALEAQYVTFAGHRAIPLVNAAKPMMSDVLGLLKKTAPFAVGWTQGAGRAVFSLRSESGDVFDVAKLAERFGGGGHRTAAGFSLSFTAPAAWADLDITPEDLLFPRAVSGH